MRSEWPIRLAWAGTMAVGLARAIAAIIAGYFTIRIANSAIERFARLRFPRTAAGERRARTLASLLKSLVRYAVDVFVVFAVLEALEVRTSVIAGAGIIGVALGFGAQSLVRDVISGLFILYEDQFGIGDHVSIQGITGIVEDMGFRVVTVRDFGGQVHFIPYGVIDRVTNYCRGRVRAMVEVPVANDEPPQRVIASLERACRVVAAENPLVKSGPRVLGVTSLRGPEVIYTIVGETDPLQNWEVERAIRKAAKEELDRDGIRMPRAWPPEWSVT